MLAADERKWTQISKANRFAFVLSPFICVHLRPTLFLFVLPRRASAALSLDRNRFRGLDLLRNPSVGLFQTFAQRTTRRPAEFFANQMIVGIPAADAQWAGDVADRDL